MTGSLCAPGSELDYLRLDDFKNKKMTDCKAYRINDHIYFHDGKSTYVCREIKTSGWAFPIAFRTWDWQDGLLQAAVKFGLIKEEVRAKETARIKKLELQARKKYVKDLIQEYKTELKKLENE